MEIYLHRNFKKEYRALSGAQQKQFRKRRDLFLQNPFHPLLHNHPLHSKYKNYRSINITGDVRVIYEQVAENMIFFIYIGTHSKLYE